MNGLVRRVIGLSRVIGVRRINGAAGLSTVNVRNNLIALAASLLAIVPTTVRR